MRSQTRKSPNLERLEGRKPLATAPSNVLGAIEAAITFPLADVSPSVTGHEGRKLTRDRVLRDSPPADARVPLFVTLHLAPGEQVLHPSASNSGGITFDKNVTVEGRTIPGSIVFFDDGPNQFEFTRPALATDSRGNFSISLTLTARLTSTEYKVVDPSGRSKLFAFPILREVD